MAKVDNERSTKPNALTIEGRISKFSLLEDRSNFLLAFTLHDFDFSVGKTRF